MLKIFFIFIDEVCLVCYKVLVPRYLWEAHNSLYRDSRLKIYSHDFVRDALFDIFKQTRVYVNKYAPMNFLADDLMRENRHLRPTNILVYKRIWEKHPCLNLIRVFSLVGLMTEFFYCRTRNSQSRLKKCSQTWKSEFMLLYHLFLIFLTF
jgi:hypothetical protein